jgi:hypothetical protein
MFYFEFDIPLYILGTPYGIGGHLVKYTPQSVFLCTLAGQSFHMEFSKNTVLHRTAGIDVYYAK